MDAIVKAKRDWAEYKPNIGTTEQQLSKKARVFFHAPTDRFLVEFGIKIVPFEVNEMRSMRKYLNRMFKDEA